MKFIALSVPLPWPHTVQTRPEVDPQRRGTKPNDFTADIADLEYTCERFAKSLPSISGTVHFMFGKMTDRDWGRWGYLHMNHHLRQFGL
jgi:hypothetical protein